jgi:asparagine synthase (glutamine-hydrolysing)
VTFLLALSADQKIRGGQTKAVLRQAVRGMVPDPIVDRQDKIGFETPEADWFRSTFQPELAALLERGKKLAIEPWVRRKRIEELWRAHVNGKKNVPRILWRLYCLEQWMRTFILKD